VNIADIRAEFGAYYIDQAQNASRIYQQVFRPSVTEEIFTPIITDETIWRASEARFQRVLQPFQKAWTPIGQTTFVPVAIQQFPMKADVEETPDDLEASWLGFLASESTDRKTWPFIKWWIENQIIPQIKQDLEMNEIYSGSFVAPTAGTAGAVSTSMDGLKKLITAQVTAGRITPFVTGALSATDATFVDQVEAFVDGINQKYASVAMELCMNETRARKFKRGYRAKYGNNANFSDTNGKVDFTNITLRPLPSMNGSNRIFCSPKFNLIRMGKKTKNMNNFQVENVDRKVKIYTDFWTGVGMVIPEVFFCNDQP